ncbi:MAG: precorrin-2 C(20)-methyltransferase [Candidatus Hydrothermarchaeales archaeon]
MSRLGKFYGVGVGPGDPELMTTKALNVLKSVDVICAPKSKKDKESIALSIVKEALNRDFEVISPVFPMTKDIDAIEEYWDRAAEMISSELEKGRSVAFVTIGDPMFYSTYVYVLERMNERIPDLKIETIPGVNSISACLAELNIPLAGRDERMAILPAAYGLEELDSLSKTLDIVVLMKVSRSFDEIVKRLDELSLKDDAIFVSGCGTKAFFSSDIGSMLGKKIDYLSMIIIRGRKK